MQKYTSLGAILPPKCFSEMVLGVLYVSFAVSRWFISIITGIPLQKKYEGGQ